MAKESAGILAFRRKLKEEIEVLLVHPGGPLWKNKEEGAWSIPKGEIEKADNKLETAIREFQEETGKQLASESEFILLKPVKIKSGKVIWSWAVEVDFEVFAHSNFFEMEWPPKSGKKQFFPEVDKAEWFTIKEATFKINSGQIEILRQLKEITK